MCCQGKLSPAHHNMSLSLRFLPQTLSVEDIGHPGSNRSIGRVLQVCCDGTVQLELSRPPGGMFGFIISQGSAHSTSGSTLILKYY